ncbi:MAG: efflux RND transporter periplasmic adaptor subunit [bacterium]|nr:efflux RND transporter periplasmic adaptor subunit [bacterium]
MNKVLKIIALVAVVAGLVFVGFKVFQKPRDEQTEIITADRQSDPTAEKRKESALPVKAIKIKVGDLPLRLNISSTADVWEKAVVKAEVSGTVESIRFSVGDKVRRGQTLLKLDDEERKLDVDEREAQKLENYSKYLVNEDVNQQLETELTEEDKKELLRQKDLYMQALKDIKTGKISRSQFEKISDDYQKVMIFSGDLREEVRKAQEGLSTSIIQLKRAQLNLARTVLKSPFQGKIAELMVSKGEKVTVGQELFKVVNLDSLYLKGFALESEVSKLKVGTRVRVRFDSYPDKTVYGELASISPEIDPERKTLNIFVKVANEENLFMPGMHAEIDIEYQVIPSVMKVPQRAVIPRQNRYLVFIVRELKGTKGVAYWEYVEIGNQNDEEIEISSNAIKEGDLVLVDGHYTLAHQSRVNIR